MITSWLKSLTDWTLQNSLDGAILFLIVFAVLFTVRFKLAPQLRIALLVIVGLRFFLPFAPESTWSLRNLIPSVPSFREESNELVKVSSRGVAALPQPLKEAGEFAVKPRIADAGKSGKQLPLRFGLIPFLWLIGFISILLITAARWTLVARRVALLRKYTDPKGQELVRRMGFSGNIRVVEAATGEGVAVFGLFRVTHLILPKDFIARFGQEGASGILRHEREHIRGCDLLWNWVILFLQSWHWFNPAVWIAGRIYRNEREVMCDRFALRNEGEKVRQTYGSTLIKALESGSFHQSAPSFISFVSRKNELKQRLELIMKNKPYQMMIQLSVVAVIAAVSITSFTTPQSFAAEEKEGERKANAERDGDAKKEGARDGEGRREGPRDGEAGKVGPRDGERRREGPRDGDVKKEGARDGDARKDGPRDGDARKEGPRDGDARKEGARDGDKPKPEGEAKRGGEKPVNAAAMNTKEGKIFTTYDKDKDNHVSAEEIEGMMEGKQNSRGRREIRKAVNRSDRDENGKLNFEEFKFWLTVGRSDETAEFR